MAMTVCRKCGAYSSDTDAFCGGCGSFLEWTGEAVAPPPAAEPAPAEPAEQERHRGWFERLSTASGSLLAGRDLDNAPLMYEPAKAGSGIGRPPAPATGSAPARPGAAAAPAPPAPPRPPAATPPAPPAGGPRPPAGTPAAPARPPAPPVPPAAAPRVPPPPPATPTPAAPRTPPPPPTAAPRTPPPPPTAAPRTPPPPPTAAPRTPPPPPAAAPRTPPPPASAAPATPPRLPPPPPAADSTPPPPGPAAAAPPAHRPPTLPPIEPDPPAPSPAAALVTPITPPAAPEPSPAPAEEEQLPQAARRARPQNTRTVPSQPRQAGDLICGDCGTGNTPSRKFCRQCGNSLATAEVQQASWWRKLLPRKRKRTMAAGTRPGRAGARKQRRNLVKSIYYKARTVGAVLVLLAGIFFGAYPPARNALMDRIGHAKSDAAKVLNHGLTEVHPTTVAGPALNPTDPAGNAFDGNRTTYWLGSFSLVKPPILTITFPRKQVLREIIISSGDQGNYVGHGRPRVLRLDFSNQKSTLLRLKDQPGPQTLPISGGVGVDKVSIRVEDVYQATQNKVSDVAIGEIEFFALL